MKDKPITFGSLTRTAYLFSSALFSLANILRISPLEKIPLRCTLAYGSGETCAWRTRWKKKNEIKDREYIRACIGGRAPGKEICDNGPQLLFVNFHQRGGDGVRSPRRDRMLNNMGTFYKRPRAAFYRPRPELEKCLCGSASTPPRNNVFQKYRRFRFLLAREVGRDRA